MAKFPHAAWTLHEPRPMCELFRQPVIKGHAIYRTVAAGGPGCTRCGLHHRASRHDVVIGVQVTMIRSFLNLLIGGASVSRHSGTPCATLALHARRQRAA